MSRCSNTVASRLFQFLGSLLQVLINRTPDEFGNRSARLLGQRQQLLELLFLQEEGCALHGHTVLYRHTCVNRPTVPGLVEVWTILGQVFGRRFNRVLVLRQIR